MEWFTRQDDKPENHQNMRRILFVYLDDEFFEPLLIDHITGKRVNYKVITFDPYVYGSIRLTGTVVYADGDEVYTMYAVFDWREAE